MPAQPPIATSPKEIGPIETASLIREFVVIVGQPMLRQAEILLDISSSWWSHRICLGQR